MFIMKKIFIALFFIFFISSCFNSGENKSVISQQLENKNIQNTIIQEKTTSIKVDFEKDLNWFFQQTNSGSKN